jgi:hypothetical protein
MSVELIKDQAYQVNDLITSYILLHNNIIKNTSSLKCLFLKVDFEEPYMQSKDMLNRFKKKKDELCELQNKLEKTIDKDKKKYLKQLMRLVEKVSKAVQILVERQKVHYQKSLGDKRNWKEFPRIQKEYKHAIAQYMEEKNKLNSLCLLVS